MGVQSSGEAKSRRMPLSIRCATVQNSSIWPRLRWLATNHRNDPHTRHAPCFSFFNISSNTCSSRDLWLNKHGRYKPTAEWIPNRGHTGRLPPYCGSTPMLSRLWFSTRRSRSRQFSKRLRPRRLSVGILESRCLLSGYMQTNLASDLPGLAVVTDPNLRNPWGISMSPIGPFWFGDNSAGVSDVVDGGGNIVPLVVTTPGPGGTAGKPTGTVFNG